MYSFTYNYTLLMSFITVFFSFLFPHANSIPIRQLAIRIPPSPFPTNSISVLLFNLQLALKSICWPIFSLPSPLFFAFWLPKAAIEQLNQNLWSDSKLTALSVCSISIARFLNKLNCWRLFYVVWVCVCVWVYVYE